mmetsp:Transcript_23314/g.55800  ORF Transcript_23314/g.55800 Transcript_23314/m.55800 type:complete len:150 (+) Transcript_23314:137-586(+)
MLKRGIMEVADFIVVNKADGQTESVAVASARQHQSALGLLPRRWNSWSPQVFAVSAHTGNGIDQLLQSIQSFHRSVSNSGELLHRRSLQQRRVAELSLQQIVLEKIQAEPAVKELLGTFEKGKGFSQKIAPRCLAHVASQVFLSEMWKQ